MPPGIYDRSHLPPRRVSEETRRKISEANRGRKLNLSAEDRQQWSEARRGRKHTAEAKRKVSESLKGNTRAQGNLGNRLSDERKGKISVAHMGKNRGQPAAGFYYDLGYKFLTGQQDHPVAKAHGAAAEHRVVLYDEIGPGPHVCHWGCGKLLEWGGRAGIQADHLDGDKLNNDLTNLVPSCGPCNIKRAAAGNPPNWQRGA